MMKLILPADFISAVSSINNSWQNVLVYKMHDKSYDAMITNIPQEEMFTSSF